jgi:hypothetical protein
LEIYLPLGLQRHVVGYSFFLYFLIITACVGREQHKSAVLQDEVLLESNSFLEDEDM